jgi:hypothetical protein
MSALVQFFVFKKPRERISITLSSKKLAPKRFNKFAFSPSVGNSGGILMGWNNSIFNGEVIEISKFSITVKFFSTHNGHTWFLTTVYGPCQGPDRDEFILWFNSLQIDDTVNWMFVGDFNFYRTLTDRNKSGGNMNDIMIFNEVISNCRIMAKHLVPLGLGGFDIYSQ